MQGLRGPPSAHTVASVARARTASDAVLSWQLPTRSLDKAGRKMPNRRDGSYRCTFGRGKAGPHAKRRGPAGRRASTLKSIASVSKREKEIETAAKQWTTQAGVGGNGPHRLVLEGERRGNDERGPPERKRGEKQKGRGKNSYTYTPTKKTHTHTHNAYTYTPTSARKPARACICADKQAFEYTAPR